MNTKSDLSVCELADSIVRQVKRCQEAARRGNLVIIRSAMVSIDFSISLAHRDGKSEQLAALLRARQH